MDIGLALLLGTLSGAGAALMLWRTVVAVRSGSIWLRGLRIIRSEDPIWFWIYVAIYLLMLSILIYGIGKAVGR